MRVRTILLAATLVSPSLALGQATPVGSVTLAIRVTPGSAKSAPVPLLAGGMSLRLTASSDGRRSAVTLAAGADSVGVGALLANGWIRVVTGATDDSTDVGISVPPGVRAMLPAPAADSIAGGYRMRFKAPATDSVVKPDKLMKDTPTARPLGTTRIVAGAACENWLITTVKDTVNVCFVEQNRSTAPLVQWIVTKLHLDRSAAGLQLSTTFSGRKLLPVRFASMDSATVVELLSASSGSPAPDAFDIPATFKPLGPDVLKNSILPALPGLIPHKP